MANRRPANWIEIGKHYRENGNCVEKTFKKFQRSTFAGESCSGWKESASFKRKFEKFMLSIPPEEVQLLNKTRACPEGKEVELALAKFCFRSKHKPKELWRNKLLRLFDWFVDHKHPGHSFEKTSTLSETKKQKKFKQLMDHSLVAITLEDPVDEQMQGSDYLDQWILSNEAELTAILNEADSEITYIELLHNNYNEAKAQYQARTEQCTTGISALTTTNGEKSC